MVNYIQDTNPFKLAGPPTWWLRRLWDFDSSLVVVPSRQGFYYRLAQRRPPSPSEVVARHLLRESDTMMMASHGLIPVTTILATANWDSPLMWQDLAERAPWRQGGADAVINHIEGLEAQKEAKINAYNEEMVADRAKTSWRLFRNATGGGKTYYGLGG